MIKIYKYGEVSNSEIFARDNIASNVEDIVTDIIYNVRKNGDKALFEYAERFDKVTLSSLEVTKEEIDKAFSEVDPEFIEIVKEAKENITAFHKNQLRKGFEIREENIEINPQDYVKITE